MDGWMDGWMDGKYFENIEEKFILGEERRVYRCAQRRR